MESRPQFPDAPSTLAPCSEKCTEVQVRALENAGLVSAALVAQANFLRLLPFQHGLVSWSGTQQLAPDGPVHGGFVMLIDSSNVTVPDFYVELGALADLAVLDDAVYFLHKPPQLPAVLKTRRFGYDGKGQAVLRDPGDVEPAWLRLGGRPLILEELVRVDREDSLLSVRDRRGATVF